MRTENGNPISYSFISPFCSNNVCEYLHMSYLLCKTFASRILSVLSYAAAGAGDRSLFKILEPAALFVFAKISHSLRSREQCPLCFISDLVAECTETQILLSKRLHCWSVNWNFCVFIICVSHSLYGFN